MLSLFTSVDGRTNRQTFWICFAVMVAFAALGSFILSKMDPASMAYFLGAPVYWIAVYWGFFCVYGQRLHDMGRSSRIFVGFTAFILFLVVMLTIIFGGGEYLSTYAEYGRDAKIDPEVNKAIFEKYQAEKAGGEKIAGRLITGLCVIFTGWIGTSPNRNV